MISLDTIESEILDLEKRDTTYAVIERLAWLYTVRDHMTQTKSGGTTVTGSDKSEFLSAVDGVPLDTVLTVLDEHLAVVAALYPREYNSILARLRGSGGTGETTGEI